MHYCGKRIKLSFMDLNSRINKYHTGVVQFQRAAVANSDWLGVILAWKKNIFASLHQMPYSNFFSVVNMNSILSLNQMKIASISNSFEQLYLGWQFATFASLRTHLLEQFTLRPPWKNLYMTPACTTWCIKWWILWLVFYWLNTISSTMITFSLVNARSVLGAVLRF